MRSGSLRVDPSALDSLIISCTVTTPTVPLLLTIVTCTNGDPFSCIDVVDKRNPNFPAPPSASIIVTTAASTGWANLGVVKVPILKSNYKSFSPTLLLSSLSTLPLPLSPILPLSLSFPLSLPLSLTLSPTLTLSLSLLYFSCLPGLIFSRLSMKTQTL